MTDPAVTAAQSSAFTLPFHDVRRVAGVDPDYDDAVRRERVRASFAVPIR